MFPCNISVKPIANLTKPNGNKPIYGGTKSRLTNANFIATVSQKAVKYFNVKSLQFTLPIIRVNQNWRTISESRGLLQFFGCKLLCNIISSCKDAFSEKLICVCKFNSQQMKIAVNFYFSYGVKRTLLLNLDNLTSRLYK